MPTNRDRRARLVLALLAATLSPAALSLPALSPTAQAAFQATTPLPQPFFGHVTLASNGFLYKLGGLGRVGGILAADTVYYAPIQPDGSLGAWKQTASAPTKIFFHTGAAANGTLYVMGGDIFDFVKGLRISDQVFYSRVQPDGSLGPWQTGIALPEAVSFPSATSWNVNIR